MALEAGTRVISMIKFLISLQKTFVALISSVSDLRHIFLRQDPPIRKSATRSIRVRINHSKPSRKVRHSANGRQTVWVSDDHGVVKINDAGANHVDTSWEVHNSRSRSRRPTSSIDSTAVSGRDSCVDSGGVVSDSITFGAKVLDVAVDLVA